MQIPPNKSINIRIENLLNSMELLGDNWDEDDAIAPNPSCLKLTKDIVSRMNEIGQSIYQVAPGPNGEIMLDFRNGGKSFELLFYPDKKIWCTFGDTSYPRQGDFTDDSLSKLLDWLNK